MWTKGESEGLQTLGIVVVVCSSLKLLHYLGLIDLSDDKIEDELEMTTVCHRPEGLEQLEAQTNFTKRELQVLYRGFKNGIPYNISNGDIPISDLGCVRILAMLMECPSGVVNEETFKQIYAQFFPHGDASTYAHYLFNAFDTTQNGSVKFEDFVMALSILLRGTVHEKLRWTFNLYDINKDGYINKEKMDKNKDGVVTLDEFIESCQELLDAIVLEAKLISGVIVMNLASAVFAGPAGSSSVVAAFVTRVVTAFSRVWLQLSSKQLVSLSVQQTGKGVGLDALAHEILSLHQICTVHHQSMGAAGAEIPCDGELLMDPPLLLGQESLVLYKWTPVPITLQKVGNNELKISRTSVDVVISSPFC
ncbi:hypothetical protein DUI87_30527 [Hirundo rustica rustica]|uniref:EF-hand domain-containing protein n=1 Tax=Hirundo rustica rustica TaxID=333673 RepID=A0A3M0IUG7_HIRRU|nr:hypothetical protein DUI87_30527 [Hirundo rustica rustica]